jgi:mevalonate kinase
MEKEFYARGKILISAEFLILHGARALAVPLTLGQSLKRIPSAEPGQLSWKAMYREQAWFETRLDLKALAILTTSSQDKSENLLNMLNKLLEIEPAFAKELERYDVLTELEFDPHFGFGSSSSLTSLLAQWAGVDPMQLHFRISRGSGYDVACAGANAPLTYQFINDMPVIQPVDFQPSFSDKMWLIYLGHKQDSSKSVAAFLQNYQVQYSDIEYFSQLTHQMIEAREIDEFGEIMEAHENRLSEILQLPTLKSERFPELDGYIKSLGAWGGDFALLITPMTREKLGKYLEEKGVDTWFAYNEITL